MNKTRRKNASNDFFKLYNFYYSVEAQFSFEEKIILWMKNKQAKFTWKTCKKKKFFNKSLFI